MNSTSSDSSPRPDLSRVHAFLSRCKCRESGTSSPEPPQPLPLQPQSQFEVDHGLTFDKSKRRHVARFTMDRGGKLVGKRVAVRIPTTDFDIAVMVRDGILSFCLAIGLKVNRRKVNRRHQCRPDPNGKEEA